PPGARPQARAAINPITTDATPTPTAPPMAPRNDRANNRLVPSGRTINAATNSTPTSRMAATMVTEVSTASRELSPATGNPDTLAASSSTVVANSARPATRIAPTMTAPSPTT